jgi:hypothetical protein
MFGRHGFLYRKKMAPHYIESGTCRNIFSVGTSGFSFGGAAESGKAGGSIVNISSMGG